MVTGIDLIGAHFLGYFLEVTDRISIEILLWDYGFKSSL